MSLGQGDPSVVRDLKFLEAEVGRELRPSLNNVFARLLWVPSLKQKQKELQKMIKQCS